MYTPQNFDHLLGTSGFSDALLQNHFTLYQGYVSNVNKLFELLSSTEAGTPMYAELKRRFNWEWNGMRLHELYFGNMTKEKKEANTESILAKKISVQFESFENWSKDFKATGAMRGIGWSVLAYDPFGDMLINIWVNEHDKGNLAGTKPLLIMDVFEHAFMLDYGLKRVQYIEVFFEAIDWKVVEERM